MKKGEYVMKRNILGPSIRDIRKENHLTQKQLSELTGFKQNTISQHESQKRELSENDLIRYSKALNIDVGKFYDHLNNGLSKAQNIVNDNSPKVIKEINAIVQKLDSDGQLEVLRFARFKQSEKKND